MPREVLRRHSSSDILPWNLKENKISTTAPKKPKCQNITFRKPVAKQCSFRNTNSNSDRIFIPSNIPVFIEKFNERKKLEKETSHSQENISKQKSPSEVNVFKKPCLRRSVSEKILHLVEFYEKSNYHVKPSNNEVHKFPHKRIKQLRKADNFVNEVETPTGVFNKPIPHTPVKIKHRRSKSKISKPAINITSQLFPYSDDIIQFYEKREDERRKIFTGFKGRLVSLDEWKNSVNNIIILAAQLHFPPALSYHVIKIIDHLFCIGVLVDVPPRLLEITALWLIAKKDYVYSKLPRIEKLIQLSSYFFSLKELIDCEWRILKNLNFDINDPDLMSIIMYNAKTFYGCDYVNVNFGNYYYVGAYMLDVLLFNRKIIQKSSLLIAGVISSLTRLVLNSNISHFTIKEIDYSIPDRIKFSFPEAEKNLVIENLIEGIKKSFNKNCVENIIYKKYQKHRYSEASKIIRKKFPKY